jgi:hypothetical protein
MYSYQSLFHQFPLFQFFNHEILVTMSSSSSSSFAIPQEKGQLGSYFKELSLEARSKSSRHSDSREEMMRELCAHVIRLADHTRKIMLSYEATTTATISYPQYVIRNLSDTYAISRAKSYLDAVHLPSGQVSLQIRLYLSNVATLSGDRSGTDQGASKAQSLKGALVKKYKVVHSA